MAPDLKKHREELEALKESFGKLEKHLQDLKAKATTSDQKDAVAKAEAALKEIKVRTNVKLAHVPFIAGSSVKSGTGQLDV